MVHRCSFSQDYCHLSGSFVQGSGLENPVQCGASYALDHAEMWSPEEGAGRWNLEVNHNMSLRKRLVQMLFWVIKKRCWMEGKRKFTVFVSDLGAFLTYIAWMSGRGRKGASEKEVHVSYWTQLSLFPVFPPCSRSDCWHFWACLRGRRMAQRLSKSSGAKLLLSSPRSAPPGWMTLGWRVTGRPVTFLSLSFLLGQVRMVAPNAHYQLSHSSFLVPCLHTHSAFRAGVPPSLSNAGYKYSKGGTQLGLMSTKQALFSLGSFSSGHCSLVGRRGVWVMAD